MIIQDIAVGVVTGYGLDVLGIIVWFLAGWKIYLFSKPFRLVLGFYKTPSEWVPGCLHWGVKWLRHEPNHSFDLDPRPRIGRPVPPVPACPCGMHRDSFTFHPNIRHFFLNLLSEKGGWPYNHTQSWTCSLQVISWKCKLVEQPTLCSGKYVCVVYLGYLNFNLYFEPHKISGSDGPEC